MPKRSRLSGRRIAGGCLFPLLLCLFGATPAWCGTEAGRIPEQAASFAAVMHRAEAGDTKAQCDVGVAYLNGVKAPQDFRKGLAWLSRSSESGFGYARLVLADVYSRGYAGVPVDDEKAYYYAALAAASSALPDKYRDRAVKLREASAKRLSPAQVAGLQAKAALAPLDAAIGY